MNFYDFAHHNTQEESCQDAQQKSFKPSLSSPRSRPRSEAVCQRCGKCQWHRCRSSKRHCSNGKQPGRNTLHRHGTGPTVIRALLMLPPLCRDHRVLTLVRSSAGTATAVVAATNSMETKKVVFLSCPWSEHASQSDECLSS
jgi:hypothetical protein